MSSASLRNLKDTLLRTGVMEEKPHSGCMKLPERRD